MTYSMILILGFLAFCYLVYLFFRPDIGWFFRLQSWIKMDQKTLTEDVLKELYHSELNQVFYAVPDLIGRYPQNSSKMLEVIKNLQDQGLVVHENQKLNLTEIGRDYALRIIRVHRLYEKYLAEKTGYHKSEWHGRAEEAEHKITAFEADSLATALGHPRFDPHGDPIPTETGEVRQLEGYPLSELAIGTTGRVIHIEDEPPIIYQQILAEDLFVGTVFRIIESNDQLIKLYAEGEILEFSPLIAANITVIPEPETDDLVASRVRLSLLLPGEKAVIDGISKECKGQNRRRLLDLGFVPGTEISIEMKSPMGNPIAYSLRDTTIALRHDLAKLILIHKIS